MMQSSMAVQGPSNVQLSEFLGDCRRVVGAAGVDTHHDHEANVSGFERSIPAVVYATSVEEVAAIVRAANQRSVPLYPISRGGNWGFGSKLPSRDGCVVLDLRRMDRIREVDGTHGYAVVEPGVTQGQLADHLEEQGAPFFLDVTGAGPDTSVLGNSLERGIAYNSLRAERVCALEVVLGNGRVVRTGFGRFTGARTTSLYPYGVGPQLDGLFMQSGFGVVTSMTIHLEPRPETQRSFLLEIPEQNLDAVVERLRGLLQRGVLRCIPHIANRTRTFDSVVPLLAEKLTEGRGRPTSLQEAERVLEGFAPSEWTAVGGISGDPRLVRESQRIVRRELGALGRIRFASQKSLRLARWVTGVLGMTDTRAFLDATAPFRAMTRGRPTEAALRTIDPEVLTSAASTDPDLASGGLLFCTPLAPMESAAARELVRIAESVASEHGFDPAITLNALNARVLEAVVSISFDRDDRLRVARAHACIAAMNDAYIRSGLPPYRVSVEHMAQVTSPFDPVSQTVSAIGSVLDPNHVIAPGRYSVS